jgi:type II restriction enzyme
LLDILLIDRTTGKNIIWATDSYEKYGHRFAPHKPITAALITGKYEKLIQPRAAKSLEEQQRRTKEKAEVFTPLNIIKRMNGAVDRLRKLKQIAKDNWQEYVKQIWLEITCGEAPFIVSRYDPTAHSSYLVGLKERVGFLDKKLQVISDHCHNRKDWLFWAKEAFKASYGYDWQGDNVLLARENLLYTLIDYFEIKFNKKPSLKIQEEFAEIISWNIFQMDGLNYVVPMSSTHTTIMDWNSNRTVMFRDLVK